MTGANLFVNIYALTKQKEDKMNTTLTQAAATFKQENAELIANAQRGDPKANEEYQRRISLEINRAIGLFDDFDLVRKEFEQIVRKK